MKFGINFYLLINKDFYDRKLENSKIKKKLVLQLNKSYLELLEINYMMYIFSEILYHIFLALTFRFLI